MFKLIHWLLFSRYGSKQYKRMLHRILRFLRARDLSEYHQIRHYVVNEYVKDKRWFAYKLFEKVFSQAIADGFIDEVGETSFKITEAGLDKLYGE